MRERDLPVGGAASSRAAPWGRGHLARGARAASFMTWVDNMDVNGRGLVDALLPYESKYKKVVGLALLGVELKRFPQWAVPFGVGVHKPKRPHVFLVQGRL